jgi:hypothetical protein
VPLRRFKEIWRDGTEWDIPAFLHNDGVNLLGEDIHSGRKNPEVSFTVSKAVLAKVTGQKYKYTFTSREQNASQITA